MSNDVTSLREKVWKILFRYRVTPLCPVEKFPTELNLPRQLHICLDVDFPLLPESATFNSTMTRYFRSGEKVQVSIFRRSKNRVFVDVMRTLRTWHYMFTGKRHINQLRSTLVRKHNHSTQPPSCQSPSFYGVPLLRSITSQCPELLATSQAPEIMSLISIEPLALEMPPNSMFSRFCSLKHCCIVFVTTPHFYF